MEEKIEVETLEKKKKFSNEEKVYERYLEKIKDIKTGKSRIFYLCLIILNICTLMVAFIWLNNMQNINCFELLTEVWDNKIFILMIAIFVIIQLLSAIPSFLKLYNKQKKRKFWTIFKSNAVGEYYNCVTTRNSGGVIASSNYLVENKINVSNAIALTHSKKIINKLSTAIFSLIILLIGAFAWVSKVNIWLYLLAFVAFVVECLYLTFIIIFAKNSKKGLAILGRLCKMLFNFKLIKDYETCYNKMVDHMVTHSKAFKENKAILLTEIASNILVLILRIVILYVALYSLSSKTADLIWQLVFCFVILDLIINLLPLQKGTLVVEMLFIMLFTYIFTGTYVFYALLIYKIFEYFMYILQFAIVWVVDKITNKIKAGKK